MKTIYAHEITNQVVTDRTRAEAEEQLAKQLADGEVCVLEKIPNSSGFYVYNAEEMMCDVIAEDHIVKSAVNFTTGKIPAENYRLLILEELYRVAYIKAVDLLSGFVFQDEL